MFNNKIKVENKKYDLNYNVVRLENGGFTLSVSKEYNGYIVDKSSVALNLITFDKLVGVLEVMCRNAVTPTSFREIAEEKIIEMMFVE